MLLAGIAGAEPTKQPTLTLDAPVITGKLDAKILTSTAEFVIGVDGIVSSSTASGLEATVDACIANVIKTIEFPRPKGGVVSVRYPFMFRPAVYARAPR